MKPVDSHCHLDFEQFEEDREKVIQRSKEKLEFIINSGSNVEHNKAAIRLQEEHPEFIQANIGLHPTYTDSFEDIEKIKRQVREEELAAIGEIGLDYHHVKESKLREKQGEVFREFLELAEELNQAVVVHTRDAERDAVAILKEYSLPDVMLHCFNGKPELAKEAVQEGMKIGISTQVLYSARVQNIVKKLQVEDMLLETDAPFLYRGERNEPLNVTESAEKIAEINSITREKVVEATTANAKDIFQP